MLAEIPTIATIVDESGVSLVCGVLLVVEAVVPSLGACIGALYVFSCPEFERTARKCIPQTLRPSHRELFNSRRDLFADPMT